MGRETGPLRVVLLGGDAGLLPAVRESLSAEGPWSVDPAPTLEAALHRLEAGGVDTVLLDPHLPDGAAMAAVQQLSRAHPTVPVVVLATSAGDPASLSALRAGAQDCVVRSALADRALGRALRHAMERKREALTLRSLEAAVDTMQIGVTITDLSGRIVYTNRAEAEMHGYAVDDLVGRAARDLSPRENWRPMSADEMRRTRRWKRERIRLRKDGAAFPVQLMSDVVLDGTGEPLGIVTTCEDITERWRAEEALRESEERYALAARGTNDGLWDWDLETGRAYFSRRWTALVGEEEQGVGGRIEEWLHRIHPEDRPRVQRKIDDHLQARTERFEDEHRIRHRDGSWRWVLARAYAARGRQGRAYRMAGAHTDVTDRRAYDPLTALPNRAVFQERLGEALARDRRRRSPSFAVLFADLDHFKAVNDTLGHVAGDEFLREVSRRLQDCVRPGDTVARFAGDEFAILLERIQDVGEATAVADRILAALDHPIRLGDEEVKPSASLGIALGLREHERPEDVIRDADAAMYRAKEEGRGRWELCDQPLRQRVAARSRVSDDLRHAAERGELGVHYQPVVDLASGALEGFEALLRWRGLLLPLDFPFGPPGPAMAAVEEWMIREACRQAGAWRARHPAAWRLYLGLSATRFLHPRVAEDLDERTREAGLTPGSVVVDVTEDALLHDARTVNCVLERLGARSIGVQVARFGAGRASLAVLLRRPLGGVKLDPSLLGPGKPSPLLAAVVDLAGRMGLPVLASGVDGAAQASTVRGLACTLGQGAYFSEPLAAADAEVVLAGGRCFEPARKGDGA